MNIEKAEAEDNKPIEDVHERIKKYNNIRPQIKVKPEKQGNMMTVGDTTRATKQEEKITQDILNGKGKQHGYTIGEDGELITIAKPKQAPRFKKLLNQMIN